MITPSKGPDTDKKQVQLFISGRVQGVGFRWFVQDLGYRLGLGGLVRNLPDRRVEVIAEGAEPALKAFIEGLSVGPPGARVDNLQVQWRSFSGRFAGFKIGF